jgi:alpha-1,2-mannosyltransferase
LAQVPASPGKAALIAAVALTAAVLGLYGAIIIPIGTGADLAPLVIAARLFAQGRVDAMYAHDPGYVDIFDQHLWIAAAEAVGFTDGRFYIYLYPPLWAAALAPFACGAIFETVLWTVGTLNLAAVGGSVIVAAALWNRSILRPIPLLLCLVALCWSYPLIRTMVLGQMQPLMVFCVVAAIAASQAGRPRLAGSVLALGAAIKLIPAVVAVYWLFTGRRDAAFWFALAGVVLAGLSLALAGWDAHLAYLDALRRMSAGYAVGFDNQSLLAWLGEAAQRSEKLHTIPIRPAPAWARTTVLVFAASAVIALIRSAPRDRSADALAAFGVYLVATIAAPSAWFHYLFCLAVPLVVLARAPIGACCGIGIAALVSMSTLLYIIETELDRAAPITWGGTIATLAVLALTAITIRRAGRSVPEERPVAALARN